MTSLPGAELTIGDLAQRTGVPAATLRSWESRYGVPTPVRLPSGHRRFSLHDVAVVLEVVRLRDAGMNLEVAIRRARSTPRRTRSVFAELTRQHPELGPRLLSKPTLLALSRAIEDECSSQAQNGLLFGAFQHETFLRASLARWVDLARTARAAVVFAVDLSPKGRDSGRLVEVPVPAAAPLTREWLVICDAPDVSACLAAVERPGSPPGRRLFESLWTVDPRVVRLASQVAAALADEYLPGLDVQRLLPAEEPGPASSDLRRAASLLTRSLAYRDGRAHTGGPFSS